MSRSEQDPSGGREQEGWPNISIDLGNIAELEAFIWKDATDQVILHEDEARLALPLTEMYIFLDGSSAENGSFSIRSTFAITDFDDEFDPRPRAVFDTFAQRNGGQRLPEDPSTYYLTTSLGDNYQLTTDDDDRIFILETASSSSPDYPIEIKVFRRPTHKEQEFEDSLRDHIFLTKEFLRELYRGYGMEDLHLSLSLKTPKTTELVKPPGTILEKETPKITLEDFGGIDDVKEELMQAVMQLQHPEILDAWEVERPNGIFLHGPPGTGKTTLAEAIANEIDGTLQVVKSKDIYGKWMGQSEKNFAKVIEEARKATKPYVLLFDEVDGVIRPDGGSAYSTVYTLAKQELGTLCRDNPNVILMATSNKNPEEIDSALFRAGRFDIHIYIPLPDESDRRAIFGTLVFKSISNQQRTVFDVSNIDFERLAAATDGFSGCDISAVVRKAVAAKAYTEILTKKTPGPVSTDELLAFVSRFRQSKS